MTPRAFYVQSGHSPQLRRRAGACAGAGQPGTRRRSGPVPAPHVGPRHWPRALPHETVSFQNPPDSPSLHPAEQVSPGTHLVKLMSPGLALHIRQSQLECTNGGGYLVPGLHYRRDCVDRRLTFLAYPPDIRTLCKHDIRGR